MEMGSMGEMSRREFLGATAAAGGALLAGGWAARPLAAAEEAGWPKLPPVKIHVVYVGTGGAWPTPTFDAPAEVAKFQEHLAGVQTRLGDVEFVGGELIRNTVPAATEVAGKLKDADAALLVHLDTMLISTGKIVELTDFHDRGCRTQITTEVSNARNMARNWCSGFDGDMMTLLHRVVFYGNHRESMKDVATLMGLKIVEET
jgi:hypothetical protein